uniref:Uncharacterized protein n=1 Tax=Avena sativa TaxID=4498 RepID=A0ACD5XVK8_AVESA
MDGGAWPARWPPPPPQPPPPPPPLPSAALAPPPLASQMDTTNLRYHLRPFAAAQPQETPAAVAAGRAAPLPDRFLSNPAPLPVQPLSNPAAIPDRSLPNPAAAMPDRLLPNPATAMPDRLLPNPNRNPWSSQFGGQPAKAGPSSDPLLAQPPGSYYRYPNISSHVLDLKALLHNPSTSNSNSAAAAGGGAVDLARTYSPIGGAVALPKYKRSGLSAGSGVEQSSLGALFLNKSSNGQEGLTSASDGLSHGGGAVQFQDPGAHAMPKLASRSIPHHQRVLPGERIRVSCLSVGGEFFMGEAGLFGVLCSCHQLRMSVAKFCEHAGGPAEKAGEIVLMENGMSIAHWFRYCVGVGAYVTDTKWDWPEWMCIDYSPEGYRLKSFLMGNSSMEKAGLFSGYGKITGPINRTSYSNDLHNEGRGCTTVEKLVNKRDETYRRSADVPTSSAKNYTLMQSSAINLGLAKSHTVDAVNLNHFSRPSGSPHFTGSTGGHYNGNHFAHNYADLLEKNPSFRNPAPRSIGVLSYDSTCRPHFSNKILQDSLGSASNTELKLGQSSYHQSRTSLFPSVQSTSIDFQKPQSHLPLITQNPRPRQPIKVNKSIGGHNEPPLGTGTNKQSIKVANGINRSEGGKLTDDAAKNSFISIFLSHLERNSEAIDNILNSSEHNLPKASDGAYSPNHSKIASSQVETRANDDHSKLASTSIHAKRRSDGGSLSMAPSGYVSNISPLANSHGPLVHSDCRSYLLPRQPNAGISKVCAGVSCPAYCRSCNHVGISHQIAHAETGESCLHDKMAKGHSTSECVDDLCTHKRMRVAEIIYQCRKSCSTSREFLPSSGQNDQSIHPCCYKVQKDVSRLGFRAGDFCHTHFSNDGAPIHKPAAAGIDKLCRCSTFIPRSPVCSREHILQSSCRECPLGGLYCRSSVGHATNSLTKFPLLDSLNKKESGLRCDGTGCYSVVPKCLAGCGFIKRSDAGIDQSGSTVQKSKHDVQLPARCCTPGESEKLRCQYSCSAQTSSLKDVSNKITNRPYVAITERPKNVSEESVANVSLPYIAVSEKKDSCRGSGVCKEQLKPGFSSGSSSAVVTKFVVSPEFNNISSCVDKYGIERDKLVFDEGSRTEKSSSTSTRCEKSLNSSSRFHLDKSEVKRKCNQISEGGALKGNEKEQCFEARKKLRRSKCSAEHSESDDSTRKFTLQSSQNRDPQPENEASSDSCRVSKVKWKRATMQQNKPGKRPHSPAEHESDDSTRKINLQSSQNGDPQPQNEASSYSCRVSKIKRKHTAMQRNKPVKRPHSPAEYSESDDSTRKITLQSSQNRNPQPRKEASSYSCRVSKMKRKHATMQRHKPVKRPHSHHKILKGDEQSDSKGIMVGELISSVEKKQVDGMDTLVRKKYQQEGSRVFVRKLPKYVSLNCIVNEPNSEDACSGGPRVDASLIATGITNDNRKFPKIVPLNLILKKAKRCHAVKPPCKTENMHSCEEKNAICSVGKYFIGNQNYSPHTEDGRQSSRKDRHSNALRPHVERDCHKPSIDQEEGEPVGLTNVVSSQLSVPASRRFKERLSSDDSCCVCRIPYLEPCNQLMECSNCTIKVHQACYGVLKVPRGQWFCRPCKAKANTQGIVCVICGYGGGAMARALNAQKILRSLLNGLIVTTQSDKKVKHNPFSVSRPRSLGNISSLDKQKSIGSAHEVSSSWAASHNTSVLDPQRMQWIHVVCGLWTPGTKCPNSTTMSAFDISGALPAKRNNVCSICNRSGGSFMMCRDINCSAIFHPWCAHQMGLLQSDPEGEHNEKIGFYGRCLNHATFDYSTLVNPEKKCLRSNAWTCARTEGFKGRKGEGCYGTNYKEPRVKKNECSVPQEQIDAWLRINGSKPCIRRQLKGWKHLVVYKSGIHGLGLYTAEFIPRGSLVIEYVGEIVGQRVADKREIEYHSGKRQQYKSVCYFFKIDKEHIIDATRKGGIARFINHSCLPNCVAKIISVRNEKKVVFFSERHINPGEEITYDYHFNQEDEGERIPCFCRSRSCRRYLN